MTYSINPTPASTNPNLDIQVERVTETRRPFISDVGIFQITLPDDDPPEEETHTEFTVDVGQIRDRVTLRATIDLVPDLRLVPSAGGTITRFREVTTSPCVGTIALVTSVDTGTIVVTPLEGIATATLGSGVTISVDDAAANGMRRVLFEGGPA